MKVMILAAGKGERMRPLTNNCPKPLLCVAGKPLLQHWLDRLVELHQQTPIDGVVVNAAYLSEQIIDFVDDYAAPFPLLVSVEREPLETAGGINQALKHLGDAPFLLINGDVFCEFDLHGWFQGRWPKGSSWGHLLMVSNPEHNSAGDFAINDAGLVNQTALGVDGETFSGLSIIHPKLICEYPARRQRFALREVFEWAIDHHRLSGESYQGYWLDVGTPERLQRLNEYLLKSNT